jgi:hypothetical protein
MTVLIFKFIGDNPRILCLQIGNIGSISDNLKIKKVISYN